MQPDNNKDNKVDDSNSKDLSLLEEADEIARIRNWTRPFAFYIMFCQAMSVGDKIRAEACMNLSEREGINSLVDPVFGKTSKIKINDKSAETKSQSPSSE
jgi:hypothetical protein